MANDAGAVDDGNGSDAGERGPGGDECRVPNRVGSVGTADALALQRELPQRGVDGRKGLSEVSGENDGEIGGAPVGRTEQLGALRTQVQYADTQNDAQCQCGQQTHRQLEATTRRIRQAVPPW